MASGSTDLANVSNRAMPVCPFYSGTENPGLKLTKPAVLGLTLNGLGTTMSDMGMYRQRSTGESLLRHSQRSYAATCDEKRAGRGFQFLQNVLGRQQS